TPDGLPVMAIIDNGKQTISTREFDGVLLSIPSSWQWTPQTKTDIRFVEAANRIGTYLGFSLNSTERTLIKKIPASVKGKSVTAFVVSPQRHMTDGDTTTGSRLFIPRVEVPNDKWGLVILDAFNNWGISLPLEPCT